MQANQVILPMALRTTILTMAALMLAACAGPGPGLTGNDTGGIVPYASVTRAQAMAMASDHCAQYGKVAYATAVHPRYGGYYSFSCRRDRRRLH